MKNQASKRISFGKIPEIIEAPDLLNIQLESWESFLQADQPPARRKNQGLQAVFKMNFPITDARENFLLEFVEYYVEKPKYSVAECEERGLTYAVPIKAKLRLSQKAEDGKSFINTIEQDVYLGNLPTMTHRGTFIINGAERVVVSQLHRSPGRVLQRIHAPEWDADLFGAHHSVPRIVGGVHDRHQQRDVRVHRPEEEIPGHHAPACPRLFLRRRDPHALQPRRGSRRRQGRPRRITKAG